MPYEWKDTAPDDTGAVSYQLRLWPYQSLPPKGFVWFIGLTAGFMALPVVAMLGTSVLWGLLPFGLMAIGGASGSTASGLKLTTVAVVVAAVVSALRGQPDTQIFGRRLAASLVYRAMAIIAVFMIDRKSVV